MVNYQARLTQLLAVCLLFALTADALAQKKDSKKKENSAPLLNVELSSKFMDYVYDYDKETADYKEDIADADGNRQKRIKSKYSDKVEKIQKGIERQIERDNREIVRARKKITKEIESLEKRLESAEKRDDQEEIDKLMKESDKVNRKDLELSKTLQVYEMFSSRCSEKGNLKDTPFELTGSSAKDFSGTSISREKEKYSLSNDPATYKIVVFCAASHRESLAALKDITRWANSQRDREITVVAIAVGQDDEERKKEFGNERIPVIHDADYSISTDYNVSFIPQTVLIHGTDVIRVTVGNFSKTSRMFYDAMKKQEKGE